MSQPLPSRAGAKLKTVRPASRAERRAAAVVCASYALNFQDPEGVCNELLDALGLYPTVETP